MKTIQEITVWDVDYTVPGHTYFVSDSKDKLFAYIKCGGDQIEKFKKPYRFGVTGRRFREVENVWNFGVDDQPQPVRGRAWQVAGSQGNEYTVTEELGAWSCTCTGFKYHGNCRHIKSLQLQTA